MRFIKKQVSGSLDYIKTFFKWAIVATVVGIAGGVVGSIFHISVDYVTEVRTEYNQLIYLLPFGGLLIVLLCKLCHAKGVMNTNTVLEAVRTDKKIPFIMAPLIFISTVITHLFGGSAGREGAALQLGGSIGYKLGKIFKLNNRDMHLVVMSGMSAVFTALFGTPLTATVFALEVVSVGMMYYAGLVPCIISAFVAYKIAGVFGIPPVQFTNIAFGAVSVSFMIKAVILAMLCAIVGIIFCASIKRCEHYFEKYIPNDFLRALVGGAIIVILSMVLRTFEYNGAGMDVINKAMQGEARPEAFILKILFTVITISAGFKGGEIVPTFFIGSTFGCIAGSILGLDSGIGAALGFVGLFCSVVNCPIASLMLAIEVFGGNMILGFAAVCAVSYMMSGYASLYTSQKFMYSKLEAKEMSCD